MPLSQKELEIFLWEQPRACEARGLRIWQSIYAAGRRYRHLSLGPSGTAQQVSVRFIPELNCYCAQVVVSTTGAISARLYLLAKKQLSALRDLLLCATQGLALKPVSLECVLIGKRVEQVSSIVHTLKLDGKCRAFTYRYDAAGLHFQEIDKGQGVLDTQEAPELRKLAADLLTERTDALTIAQATRADALAGLAALPPVDLTDLVVTPAGVLANPDALH